MEVLHTYLHKNSENKPKPHSAAASLERWPASVALIVSYPDCRRSKSAASEGSTCLISDVYPLRQAVIPLGSKHSAMNSKSNGAGERQTKKSSNFDSEPADDGFRNYMARKIELQRKQFGLVLPPPPPTSEPPPILMKKPDEDTLTSKMKDHGLKTITDADPTKKKKIKSVRFHENVEIEGVSQVLKGLQRKHNVEKSRKRKLQSPSSNSDSVDNATGKSDNDCDTILGVLNDLQKRHGACTPKKMRRSKCIDRSSLEGMEPIHEEMSSVVDTSSCDSPGHSHPTQEHSSQHLKTHTPRIEPGRTPNHRPDLFFTGVVVLVNGHTSPDATTIMRLLHKHGGDLEKYETRRVTHIIAEKLSSAKANIYKSQQKPTPVCRPEWITESVECGKLLPFANYLLDNVRSANALGKKSVQTFFGTKKRPNTDELIDNSPLPKKDTNKVSTEELKPQHRWHDTNPSETNYHLNGQVRTVGNDPNFLESYFSSSRLSYIGSFQQRVKQVKQSASSSKSLVGSTKFVLLVDMDCFFASVALRKYPQYVDKPVAVGHSHVDRPNTTLNTSRMKNSSSELSTCNYIARKCGIRKGMFLGKLQIR